MGTHALTRIFEHGAETPLVTLYRQLDGYPDGHGRDLLAFAKGMPITCGIRGDGKGTANGMGCFAAQLIARLKTGVGGHYVTEDDPGWGGYAYDIRPDRPILERGPATLLLRVTHGGRVIYDGPLDAWDGSEPSDEDGGRAVTAQGPTLPYDSYLGGSRIAAVAGLHPYKTALDVWAQLRGVIEDKAGPEAEAGNVLERPILEGLYAPRRGVSLAYPGTLLDADEPFMGATPDAIADGAIDVQCKLVGLRQARRWDSTDLGADGIPPEVYAQVTWEMGVARLSRANVVAQIGTETRVYEVELDVDFLDDLRAIARPFWSDCVKGGALPSAEHGVGRKTVEALYPRVRRGMVAATAHGERLAKRYERLRRAVKTIEERQENVANELRLEIGDAEGIEGPWGRAKWQARAGSVRWKDVAMELGAESRGDIIARHTGQPTRALDVRMKGA
ncbi:MAG: YqaJ viral recombinase family protein [Polyangiaceae bacterium]|nr:YqaJ viral recombinase family protein [Polyangiaceae bacterium]